MAKKQKKGNHPSLFEGLPVVDASKDIDLIIDKRDVADSRKKDPENCAAARAGKREFHTDVRVYMTRTYVKDKEKKRWIRFITPMAISKEIISFDRGAIFEPGAYVLKAPSKSTKLGYSSKPTGPKEEKGKKSRVRHVTANVRISAKDKMVASYSRNK